MKIRAYQPEDLPCLLSAWEKASRLAHPFMNDDFFDQERKNIPELYIPNTDTWVMIAEDQFVGFIAVIVSKPLAEIGGLFVDPAWHRKDIGQALVNKARENYGDLTVRVFKDNAIGRSFYQKFGFVEQGEEVWPTTGDILLAMHYQQNAL